MTTIKIDYTSLKAWVPDYANMSATNLWASGSTATMSSRGFVYAFLYGYVVSGGYTGNITINGKLVSSQTVEQAAPNNARPGTQDFILPVNNGDVIAYTLNGTVNQKQLNFIPGRWI